MKLISIKYFEGRATKVEQVKLLAWLRLKKNSADFHKFRLMWRNSLDEQQFSEGSGESWNKIQAVLLQKSYNRWQEARKVKQFFRVAAIFFFVISLGSLAYFFINPVKQLPETYTSVLAENGQISKVELPDGSLVWLNSGSKISYNNYFASNNRNISLSGEAYFQVRKNEDIPLVVNSGDLQIKVLGTKFNVSTYPEANEIEVVLETGAIELLNSNIENFSFKLKPGELAVFNKIERNLVVSEVIATNFTSWKEGIINIYNQSLEDLVKRLENRYNQKFEFDESVKNYRYTFSIKNESLDEILKLMEKITPVKIFQKGNTILIKLVLS
jgi:transmembrane sensor